MKVLPKRREVLTAVERELGIPSRLAAGCTGLSYAPRASEKELPFREVSVRWKFFAFRRCFRFGPFQVLASLRIALSGTNFPDEPEIGVGHRRDAAAIISLCAFKC